MNLITCAEDCEYQKDGYCNLCGGAPVSAVQAPGCGFFRPRRGAAPIKIAQQGKGSPPSSFSGAYAPPPAR